VVARRRVAARRLAAAAALSPSHSIFPRSGQGQQPFS
jgi:hypothetical protein